MQAIVRMIPVLVLVAFTGACASASAYQPAMVYQVSAQWADCNAQCRLRVVAEVCPRAPKPSTARQQTALEAKLMNVSSRDELVERLRRQPECADSQVYRVSHYNNNDEDNGRYGPGYNRGRRVTDPQVLRRYGVSKSVCYGKPAGYRFSRPVAGGGTAWYTCP